MEIVDIKGVPIDNNSIVNPDLDLEDIKILQSNRNNTFISTTGIGSNEGDGLPNEYSKVHEEEIEVEIKGYDKEGIR